MPEPRTPQSPEPPSWPEWKAQHQQKPWYRRYPLAVEWLLEQTNDRLHRWAFIEFLEHVGKFTVLIAVIVWVLEADNRAKERHYRAWELINSARGSTGDGGRIDALEDLSKDGVNLAAAPLKKALLTGVDLRGAGLSGADLQEAHLVAANLKGANLILANLKGANLIFAHLVAANLRGANLRGANLRGANLMGANLGSADMEALIFMRIEPPRGAKIGADLEGADLVAANLRRVDLRWVEGLTQEQLDSALGDDKTLLPEHLTRPAHWKLLKSEEPAE